MSESRKKYTEKQHRRALVENEAMDSRLEDLYIVSKYGRKPFRSPSDARAVLGINPSRVAEKFSKDYDFLEKLSPEAYQVLENHFLAQKEFRDTLPEDFDRAEIIFFFKKVFGFLNIGFKGDSHLDFLVKISSEEDKKELDNVFNICWRYLVSVCKSQNNWPIRNWSDDNETEAMLAARKSFNASLELAKSVKKKDDNF